jgi:peptide chain release factor 2
MMSEPDFWNDKEKSTKIPQEVKLLKKEIELWSKFKKDILDLKELVELANEEGDEELLIDAEKNLVKLEKIFDTLQTRVMLSDTHDSANAYLDINSGAGGTEACDWAQMLLRMYIRWAESHDYSVEIIEEMPGDEAGIKSATIKVTGDYAYGYLKSEIGVHRLVRISPFDSNSRRHTSFASVFVFPEIEDDINVEINQKDLRVDTFRASGAGGQHVNKTDSAVRITHIPTGEVVVSQSQRSQHQNRETAMKMLKAKLYNLYMEEKEKEREEQEKQKKKIEWGSQIRNYTFQPYTLVKDLRTKYEMGNADAVMDGEIDGFINAYLKWRLTA